jgi:hypothetical protein
VTVTDERLAKLIVYYDNYAPATCAALRELQSARAQLASLQRDHAASAAQRDARVAALARLASCEAFDVSRVIDPVRDKELLMRMEYAEAALAQPDAARPAGEQ